MSSFQRNIQREVQLHVIQNLSYKFCLKQFQDSHANIRLRWFWLDVGIRHFYSSSGITPISPPRCQVYDGKGPIKGQDLIFSPKKKPLKLVIDVLNLLVA